jgi:hypothetical protein
MRNVLTQPFKTTSIRTINDAAIPLKKGGALILTLSDLGDG